MFIQQRLAPRGKWVEALEDRCLFSVASPLSDLATSLAPAGIVQPAKVHADKSLIGTFSGKTKVSGLSGKQKLTIDIISINKKDRVDGSAEIKGQGAVDFDVKATFNGSSSFSLVALQDGTTLNLTCTINGAGTKLSGNFTFQNNEGTFKNKSYSIARSA